MSRFIVVAGGVISGVGKGVTTASIAKILKEYGYKVTSIKIDPYINFDAGTLRPTEHGEVWVTDDGGEIDQDLGTYERFINEDLPKINCMTTGQIYKTVIDNERKGAYLGKTVQFIPHITDEIKRRITCASRGFDFCLVEIGGTIGDFENIPFLFAVKSLEREIGKKNMVYVLVTFLPTPSHIEEMKTKPTQQAIRMLSENGIIPDFIICRAAKALDEIRKKKIETYANIDSDHVISEPDIDTVYRIPLDLENENFGIKLLKDFNMQPKKRPELKEWAMLVGRIINPSKKVKVGIIGKYVEIGDYQLADSYISINESLKHAGASLDAGIMIEWVDAKEFEKNQKKLDRLKEYNGIIVPGGFGSSGVEGKIMAIKYARENNIPFLGLCYGLQLAVVEYARNICKLDCANTTEVDKSTRYPVIDLQPSQRKVMEANDYGGTMRLGAYAAMLENNSKVLNLYSETGRVKEDNERLERIRKDKTQLFRIGILDKSKKAVIERHRHRYEVNNQFTQTIEDKGMVFSGFHERLDGERLMEFIELPKHRFFIGTQAHPEFKSRLGNPHPLFYGFVRACLGN